MFEENMSFFCIVHVRFTYANQIKPVNFIAEIFNNFGSSCLTLLTVIKKNILKAATLIVN